MNTWLLSLGLALSASQAGSTGGSAGDAPLSPRVEAARFVVGGREVAPIGVEPGVRGCWRVGARELRVGQNRLIVVDPALSAESRAREVALPTGELVWLASAGDCAYFTTSGAGVEAAVLRLDLSQARWLEPWPWRPRGGPDSPGAWSILALTVDSAGTFVLAQAPNDPDSKSVRSEVRRLDPNSGATLWSRSLDQPRATEGPGAVLLAPMRNAPLGEAPPSMAVAADRLIVCPPSGETIEQLAIADGANRNRIERPWELERAFVGPSVWQHYIGRFGLFPSPGGPEAAEVEQKRAAFEAHTKGAIVAGPYVAGAKSDEQEPRWFVVCARMPSDGFGNQVAQQFVYEFDALGEPLSIVALPRPILGPAVELDGAAWLFACSRGSAVAVARSDSDPHSNLGMAFPGSGFDCVGRIAWFSDAPVPATRPWLASAATSDLAAVSRRLAISSLGGGEIEKPDARRIEFPFRFVDPLDGRARHARLVVPFDGQPKLPSTNFQSDGVTTRVWGSLDFAVTRVDFVGDRLELTIGSRNSAWTIDFEVALLLERA